MQSGDSDSEEEEEYREPAVKLPKVRAAASIGCFCDDHRRARVVYLSDAPGLYLPWKGFKAYPFYCDTWSHLTSGFNLPS